MNECKHSSKSGERARNAGYAPFNPRTASHSAACSPKEACCDTVKKSHVPYSPCACEKKPETANACGCAADTTCTGTAFTPVMAYVPRQDWEEPFCEMEALCVGTLFPSLEKPFVGKGGCC